MISNAAGVSVGKGPYQSCHTAPLESCLATPRERLLPSCIPAPPHESRASLAWRQRSADRVVEEWQSQCRYKLLRGAVDVEVSSAARRAGCLRPQRSAGRVRSNHSACPSPPFPLQSDKPSGLTFLVVVPARRGVESKGSPRRLALEDKERRRRSVSLPSTTFPPTLASVHPSYIQHQHDSRSRLSLPSVCFPRPSLRSPQRSAARRPARKGLRRGLDTRPSRWWK